MPVPRASLPPVPENLKAVIFDLDGTLYDLKRLRIAVLAALLRHLGLHPRRLLKASLALRHYRKALEQLRLREQPCEDLHGLQLTLAARHGGAPESEVAECIQRWFVEVPRGLLRQSRYSGLTETLDAIAAAGLQMAVLSDYPAIEKLEALGVRHYFSVVVSAQEVGFLKPHSAGLLQVMRQLKVQPAEALYVGDRYDLDAGTARRAGVRCAILGSEGRQREDCVALASIAEVRQFLPAPVFDVR
jgi:HAD superfamily hydrolase (TIGR01549 family)